MVVVVESEVLIIGADGKTNPTTSYSSSDGRDVVGLWTNPNPSGRLLLVFVDLRQMISSGIGS